MPSRLLLPRRPPEPQPCVAVDLFAGAGGFSTGFHDAGYAVLAAAEWDVDAALSYMINLGQPQMRVEWDRENTEVIRRRVEKSLPKKRHTTGSDVFVSRRHEFGSAYVGGNFYGACEYFFVGDIRKLDGEYMLDRIHMNPGEVDVVIGGPPCQGYSAGGHRDVMDPRNSMVFEFVRLVIEIKPKSFVMENVAGMIIGVPGADSNFSKDLDTDEGLLL